MINPMIVHIETLFSFLKLFSFDGKILDEKKFYEFFGKDSSNVLNQIDDDLKIHFPLINIGFYHLFCYFGSTRIAVKP